MREKIRVQPSPQSWYLEPVCVVSWFWSDERRNASALGSGQVQECSVDNVASGGEQRVRVRSVYSQHGR